MDIDETEFYSEGKSLPEIDKEGNSARLARAIRIFKLNNFHFLSYIFYLSQLCFSTKKIKLEDCSSDKHKVQRNIIPSKENPPAGIHSWIQKYQVSVANVRVLFSISMY